MKWFSLAIATQATKKTARSAVVIFLSKYFFNGLHTAFAVSKHFPVQRNQSWLWSENLAESRSPAISYMRCWR